MTGCAEGNGTVKRPLYAVLGMVAAAAIAQEIKSDEWMTKLQSTIRQYHTNAVVTVENGAYVYRYHTQNFKIHSIQMTGAISETAHDEEGPNVDGILLTVKLGKGVYAGQAEIPQVLHESYWRTFINAYPVSLPVGAHLWMSLSYGGKSDTNLVHALETCFGDVRPPEH